MPRDRHVNRALALQRDPNLPPSLALEPGACPIMRPDGAMKERLERHEAPLPVCPDPEKCPVRAFFASAAAAGAPVELEVGSGYGRFAMGHAAAHPEIRFFAVEQDEARVARSDVASRKRGLSNVGWLAGEARYALEYCVPPGSVSAAFVLFPDPWPKDRHARNRFFRAPNVELVWRALKPGGALHAATDDASYFAEAVAAVDSDPRFERVEPYWRGPDEQTDFERKFLAQGKTVNRASWRKRG